MTDAQALSRWVHQEIVRIRAEQPATARYINAIRSMSAIDATMMFAVTLMTDGELPDLDAIKDDAA